jgi:hypothetical protein
VKYCEAIDIEVTPTGAVFRGKEWPPEIAVERNLLDYLPPQGYVQFGRMGVLRFNAVNGYAVYRRFEDIPGGWNYRLVEHELEVPSRLVNVKAAPEPVPAKAESQYRKIGGGPVVNAFQWQPHAVPPVALPEWFVRADFEHNAKGELVIRQLSGPMNVGVGDWIVKDGDKIAHIKAAAFAKEYAAVQ